MINDKVSERPAAEIGLLPLEFMPPILGKPVVAPANAVGANPAQTGWESLRGGISRLVILLPDEDVDEARLSRHLWMLASPGKLSILLITQVEKPGDEYTAMRRMIRIGGITQDIWIKVEARVIFGPAWIKTLGEILQPSDLFLCPAEKVITGRGFHAQPLSLALSRALSRPVYLLTGFFTENHPSWPQWTRQIPFWIGCLVVMGIFSWLEVDVSHMASGWVAQLILAGLVFVEIGFLYLLSTRNG
jgi:hypothetical protein